MADRSPEDMLLYVSVEIADMQKSINTIVKELTRLQANMGKTDRASDELSKGFGQASKTVDQYGQGMRRLQAVVDAQTRAELRLKGATDDVNAAFKRGEITDEQRKRSLLALRRQVTETTKSMERLAAGTRGYALASTRGLNSTRAMGTAIQQGGYQVGDFAVQIASGQDATRAFVQQGTQLVSMFGPWGAAIGAAGAIVGAFVMVMRESEEAAKASKYAQEALGRSIAGQAGDVEDLTEKYEDLTTAQRNLERINLLVAQRGALENLGTAVDDLRDKIKGTVSDKYWMDLDGRWTADKLKDVNDVLDSVKSGAIPTAEGIQQIEIALLRSGTIAGLTTNELLNAAAAVGEVGEELDKTNALLAFFQGTATDAQKALIGFADSGKKSTKSLTDEEKALKSLTESVADYRDEMDPVGAATREFNEGLALLEKSGLRNTAVWDDFIRMFGDELTEVFADNADAVGLYVDQLERENELTAMRLDGKEELVEYLKEQDKWEEKLGRTLSEQEKQQLKVAIAEKKRLEATEERLKESQKAIEKYQKEVMDTAEDIGGDVADYMVRGMTEGFEDGFDGLRDMFKRFMMDLAATALRNRIFVPIAAGVVGSAPGLFGIDKPAGMGGTGSGGMQATDILSGLTKADGLFAGGNAFAGADRLAAKYLPGTFNSAVPVGGTTAGGATNLVPASMQPGGSLPFTAGQALGGLGVGFSAYNFAKDPSLSSGVGLAGSGAAFASTFPAVQAAAPWLGPVGIAAMIAAPILGSMFGGKEANPAMSAAISPVGGSFGVIDSRQKHMGDGAVNDLAKGFVDATNAAVEQLLGTDVTMTGGRAVHVGMDQRAGLIDIFGAGGPELERLAQFSMEEQGEAMNRAILEAIKRADFDGLGENVATAIANTTAENLDDFAADIEFAKGFDKLFTWVDAVPQAVQELEALEQQFDVAETKARELGLATDDLSDRFQTFTQNLVDDLFKVGKAADPFVAELDRLKSVFDAVKVKAEEMGLSTALMTERYEEARQAVIDESMKQRMEALRDLQSGLTADYEEQMGSVSRLRDQMQGLAATLRQTRLGLLIDPNLSPLAPSAMMNEAQRQFDAIAGRARLGDVEAMGELPEISRQYLEIARGFYASSEDYARIFEAVQDTLGDAETLAERHVRIADEQLRVQRDMLGALVDESKMPDDPLLRAVHSVIGNESLNAGVAPDGRPYSTVQDFSGSQITLGEWRAIGRLGGFRGDFGQGRHMDFLNSSAAAMDQWQRLISYGMNLADGAIPAFANGGLASPGLALVGEAGPELVDFRAPARVYTNDQLSAAMSSDGGSGEVVRELRALVRVTQASNVALREELHAVRQDVSEIRAIKGRAA